MADKCPGPIEDILANKLRKIAENLSVEFYVLPITQAQRISESNQGIAEWQEPHVYQTFRENQGERGEISSF